IRIVSFRVVQSFDRHGHPVSELAWTRDGALASARVRLPDGEWLAIEPRATTAAPWGLADRVWRAERFPEVGGPSGEPLPVFEAADRPPVLAGGCGGVRPASRPRGEVGVQGPPVLPAGLAVHHASSPEAGARGPRGRPLLALGPRAPARGPSAPLVRGRPTVRPRT